MGLSIPLLPAKARASALLHGSYADFVTNAYLALQRQWPDEGGYAHYMYALGQLGARRADVLREIANSPNARQCGVVFIDDLPPDHEFQPEEHDRFGLLETSLNLRLARLAADMEQMRLAVGRLTAEELAKAVEGMAQAQLVHQAVLESRLNAMALPDAEAVPADTDAAAESAVVTGAWRHLAAQQMAWLQPANDGQDAVGALQAELAELRQEVQRLRDYTTVGLKREVADYVNALHAATVQSAEPTPTRRASTRDSRSRHHNVHPIERASRTGT